MKLLKTISCVTVLLLLNCQSKQKINTNFLIGQWQTLNSNYDTLFGKYFSTNSKASTVLKFTNDELFINDKNISKYNFTLKDSSVVLHYKKEVEVISIRIFNKNEFETTDNMGLKLQFKRIN